MSLFLSWMPLARVCPGAAAQRQPDWRLRRTESSRVVRLQAAFRLTGRLGLSPKRSQDRA